MIKIPITNQPNQTFKAIIPVNGLNIELEFYFFWNRIAEYWHMSVKDVVSQVQLLSNIPMLISAYPTQNLISQFKYLNIGEAYIIPITQAPPNRPGINDWDSKYVLLWSSS